MTTNRANTWSVTINNPIPADEESIAMARQKGWKVEGQLEKGENGTPHYQLMLKTPQVRFSAIKKQFPRAHIEQARNPQALSLYVKKEETREGELLTDQSKYPSLQTLWDMFAEYIDEILDYRGSDDDEGISEWSKEYWLKTFDNFICEAILKGYVVETMAVNPQIRSCIKLYGLQLFLRSIDRQTDRQTPEKVIEGEGITNALEERDDKVEDEGQYKGSGERKVTSF